MYFITLIFVLILSLSSLPLTSSSFESRLEVYVNQVKVFMLSALSVSCNESPTNAAVNVLSKLVGVRVDAGQTQTFDYSMFNHTRLVLKSTVFYEFCKAALHTSTTAATTNTTSTTTTLMKEDVLIKCAEIAKLSASTNFVADLSQTITNTTDFINQLREQIGKSLPPSSSLLAQSPPINNDVNAITSITIIGAGPVGLFHGLLIRSFATPSLKSLRVLERRPSFQRDIWFDLYGKEMNSLANGFDSLGVYVDFGIRYVNGLNASWHEDQEGSNVALTVSCLGLQRFTSKILYLLGVDVEFDREIKNLDEINFYEDEDDALNSSHHLIIVADGAHSLTRNFFNVSYGIHDNKNSTSDLPYEVPKFGQATLIVNMSPSNTDGSCPKTKDNQYSGDPYSFGFDEVLKRFGVTSIFKRFEHYHCELQFFFRLGATEQLGEPSEFVIKGNFSNQMRRSEHDIFFKTIIDRVLDLAFLNEGPIRDSNNIIIGYQFFYVHPQRVPIAGNDCSLVSTQKKCTFIVVGDAAMTAHFRIGLGLNHAIMLASKNLPMLVGTGLVQQYANHANDMYEQAMAVMNKYIVYEGRCNFVLYLKEVWRRDWKTKRYMQIDDDRKTILEFCEDKERDAKRIMDGNTRDL